MTPPRLSPDLDSSPDSTAAGLPDVATVESKSHKSASLTEPKTKLTPWRVIRHVLNGIIMLVILVFVWPQQWGGLVTFAIVAGESMEPEYHTGDVVVAVRSLSGYAVGDIVVYEVHEGDITGRIVHKIVSQNADGTWVLQGINKPFPDPWQVPSEWIIGKVDLMIPQGYQVLLVLRSPIFLAVICGLLITSVFWPRKRPEDEEPDADVPSDAVADDDNVKPDTPQQGQDSKPVITEN